MYLVIGNTPKRVELKDLSDFVYYKQQKLFTDAQYNSSMDLQREIQKGSLTILKKTEEKSGSFEIPSVAITGDAINRPTPEESPKFDVLLDRIKTLESSLGAKNSAPPDEQYAFLTTLTNKVQRLEKELSGVSNEKTLTVLFNAIKQLEEKISQGSNDLLVQKIADLVSRAPVVVNDNRRVTQNDVAKEEFKPDEIYVPNISIEDANTHIKLQVRTIESGDNMSDSLRRLKELKSKSK